MFESLEPAKICAVEYVDERCSYNKQVPVNKTY